MIEKEQTAWYSDELIVRKVGEGEVALFEILIRRYNSYLYKVGRSYNFQHEDTQDLMQDTFMNAFANLSKFEGRSSFKTWIIRIMLNNCFHKKQKFSFKNEISKEINERSIPMFSDQMQPDSSTLFTNRELKYIIENALQQVPVQFRMVFSLREINGLSVIETAEVMGITESNVKVRLNRAKDLLRKQIERSYTAEEIFEFNLVFCDAMVKRVMAQIR